MILRRLIPFIVISCSLLACDKKGTIRIVNKVDQTSLEEVEWGDHLLAQELLPGESEEVEITKYMEELPSSHVVQFKMSANGNRVFLQTREEFFLDYDDMREIIIDDDTEVINPNDG